MIDKERRKKLAYHLRHLANGVISNDNFEDFIMDDVTYGWLPEQYYRSKYAKSDDPIIAPILELSWSLYTDCYNHKVKLSDEQLKIIARYILFLHSDIVYSNIINPFIRLSFKDILLNLATFGNYNRNKLDKQKQDIEILEKSNQFNQEYWPFINKEQYESQLKHQPFLNGNR